MTAYNVQTRYGDADGSTRCLKTGSTLAGHPYKSSLHEPQSRLPQSHQSTNMPGECPGATTDQQLQRVTFLVGWLNAVVSCSAYLDEWNKPVNLM